MHKRFGCSIFIACTLLGGCDRARSAGADLGVGDGGSSDIGVVNSDLLDCVNLQCRQAVCPVNQQTTVTGTVVTPNGALPLYDVSVFVPNGTVAPFVDGVDGMHCDSCADFTSATPLVSALTKPDGTFTLLNVPTGDEVPLVLQVGKWRTQLVLPHIDACTTVALDPTTTRMPAKQSATGHIPKIAIATGNADPFECLLLKVGLDPSEMTTPTGGGRVSFYQTLETSSGGMPANGIALAGGSPDAATLFGSLDILKQYDIVLLPCEGSEYQGKPQAETDNMKSYADLGGRLFTTHYSYVWLHGTNAHALPWNATGHWDTIQPSDVFEASAFAGKIDQTFPKGMAFASWLDNVGASTTPGELDVHEWRHDLDTVTNPPSQRWVYGGTPAHREDDTSHVCMADGDCATSGQPCDTKNGYCTKAIAGSSSDDSVQHFTFNTPIDEPPAMQCGRVVYSDFHVSVKTLKATTDPTNLGSFPSICDTSTTSAQEKALIFMLFDLSACVQDDSTTPTPPPIL